MIERDLFGKLDSINMIGSRITVQSLVLGTVYKEVVLGVGAHDLMRRVLLATLLGHLFAGRTYP